MSYLKVRTDWYELYGMKLVVARRLKTSTIDFSNVRCKGVAGDLTANRYLVVALSPFRMRFQVKS